MSNDQRAIVLIAVVPFIQLTPKYAVRQLIAWFA